VNGLVLVLDLAAALIRLGHDAGWAMREHNRRFNFVAVLPARPAAPLAAKVALREQVVDW
jgi:hypothetical protein